jgi:regulator of sigma E protease
VIEAIRGKPIPPEKEGMVHLAGFMALMLLMVLVLFNDISRLFR